MCPILVIDDNPKVKISLALAFPEYQFLSVLSGEEGLKYLSRPHEIDLVLLDYKMDGMNGIEALKEIRRRHPSVSVILLTSFGTKEVAVEALRAHADDFIDKTFDVSQMRRKLEEVFRRRAAEEMRSGAAGPMQRVMRFVERNYQKSPTLEDVAEKASLSPKYVSRKFKKETSRSFGAYKVELKIEQAKKLLRETALGVAQIAYQVGYQNAESFMKMFKKTLDCTPTEYRMRSRQKSD